MHSDGTPASTLRLELLTSQHRGGLERFELTNREFFASRIGDRGDDYFEHFPERLAALVGENDAGRSLAFVLVDEAGAIVARINITDVDQPELTELGYRVAESAQGKGVATSGVRAALDVARARGVRRVTARVAHGNPASRRVLEHCGFMATGPTDPPAGSPKSFTGYRVDL